MQTSYGKKGFRKEWRTLAYQKSMHTQSHCFKGHDMHIIFIIITG